MAADPFAPPSESSRRPRAASRRPVAPAEPAPSDAPARRPSGGAFWIVAVVGIGLLCLAQVIQFFTYINDLDGEDVAPAIFGVFGTVALAIGLALAALLQRDLSAPVRAALLLGAGYFAASGGGFGLLAALTARSFF